MSINQLPKTRTCIKICGITQPIDAITAAQLGVDAIGLVFYAASPRYVSVPQAQAIIQTLPPFVTVVGLFVNAAPSLIQTILTQMSLDRLQFHGDETPDYCSQFGKPYIKAIRMRTGMDVIAAAQRYTTASALLLDTYVQGIPGGTGISFDWQQIPTHVPKPIILAGGLTAENVAQAVMATRPYAVDVSGGVESAKGIKDVTKMADFVQALI